MGATDEAQTPRDFECRRDRFRDLERLLRSRTGGCSGMRRLLEHLETAAPISLWVYSRIERKVVYTSDGRVSLRGQGMLSTREGSHDAAQHGVHPGDQAGFARALAKACAAEDGEVVGTEYRTRHPDGTWRWLHTRITVFTRTPQGRVESVLAASLDVTERRRLDEVRAAMARAAALASARKRRALAEALHDGLGQLLPILRTKLALLRERSPSGPDDPRWGELDQLILEAHREASSLTLIWSPSVPGELGLPAALHSLADDLANRYGLRVSLQNAAEALPLSRALETAVLHSLQELLENVAKHARVEEARVEVSRGARQLRIVVEDRGVGFEADRRRGNGLARVREQIRSLGGSLRVRSAPARGTRVTLIAPLALEAADSGDAWGKP